MSIMSLISMSLKDQCHSLGIDLVRAEKTTKEKPEIYAFNLFTQEGYVGSYSEFGGFRVCLQSLCLDALTETSPFFTGNKNHPSTMGFAREDACLGAIMRISTYDKTAIDKICEDITKTTKDKYVSAYLECLSHPMLHQFVKGLDLGFAEALFDAVPKSDFVKITKWLSADWDNRSGWPDLTIVKGNRLRFVEVKTTDKLHASQINTIPSLMREIGAEVSVLQLKNYVRK